MRRLLALMVFGASGLGVTLGACSSTPPSFDTNPEDASTDTGNNDQKDSGDLFSDSGDAQGCVNLECKQKDCLAEGRPDTTISGFVYDPAGRLPLYNVYVYVPNAPTSPIEPGNVECKPCQAPASGSPLVAATTDSEGHFVIHNAPVGNDIPLVMQVGKWRRQITISVAECTDNPLTDIDQTRLPRNQQEGDMPQIAFTSGCDPAECFLRRLGIDDAEFTPPSGNGRVHFYTGQGGTTIAGGVSYTDTYTWWSDPENLKKYDIVFNACECSPFSRSTAGDAYGAIHEYLNSGGRVFATHYFYNWFAPPTGHSDFQSVVQWHPEGAQGFSKYFINTDFPKGLAFADWLHKSNISTTYGQVPLTDLRYDMDDVSEGATAWIYAANNMGDTNNSPVYVSFNTPVGIPAEEQCGRAVFSDVHLSGNGSGQFPSYCGTSVSPGYDANEKALEFLFFDLSSCVQDDTKPPPPPPPN